MLFVVTFVFYGFISNATTSQNIIIGNYRTVSNHGIAKKCIKNIVSFSPLSDNQISNLMLRSLMTSPKQITQEKQVIFPNDKQRSATTNEIFTPDKFHNHLET